MGAADERRKLRGALVAEGWPPHQRQAFLAAEKAARARAQGSTDQPINFKPGMSLNTLIQDGRGLYKEPVADSSASTVPYVPPNALIAGGKWLTKIWPGGDWDYKRENLKRYEGLGNYAYGVTGTALGIPESVLVRGAGAAQDLFHLRRERTGRRPGYDPAWGRFWQGAPYGDDPRDQASINKGIQDARAAMAAEPYAQEAVRRRRP